MSRVTHDIECQKCGFAGKVLDDVIICPECGRSVEGQAISVELLAELIRDFKESMDMPSGEKKN
ncbi:MAG TPA: hypothetical protein VJ227_04060 [Patescibacteria group bacterium]|nr:hypothetical protein [Patescibacteria group bacterium]